LRFAQSNKLNHRASLSSAGFNMDAKSWNRCTTKPDTRVAIEAAARHPKIQLKQQ
jgi:hypothetical protein